MEIPWLALLVFFVITPFYFMVGMPSSASLFFFYLFVVWIVAYIFISFGMLAGALFPTTDVAQTVVGILVPLTFLFGGLYLPFPNIPIYWRDSAGLRTPGARSHVLIFSSHWPFLWRQDSSVARCQTERR